MVEVADGTARLGDRRGVPGRRGSARLAAPRPLPPGRVTAVVVLGYPSLRSGRPHPVQRWRSALAVRTVMVHDASLVVFSGGAPKGGRPEAEVMADLAGGLGLRGPSVVAEVRSTTTLENVLYSQPLVGDADRVILVSDPLHAARARSYWLRDHPDDDGRVAVTDRCRLGDGWWLKVPTAAHALRAAWRDRSPRRDPARNP